MVRRDDGHRDRLSANELGSVSYACSSLFINRLFVLNVVVFALAFVTSIVRYTLYPEIWRVMIQDPTNSLFLATVPMGFATLIEMWVFICVPRWGEWATSFAWALWMVDVVAAASVTLSLSFLLSVDHRQNAKYCDD
jgi:C4-dicarboxylate transporter/malic acid transport protein.